jgi:Tol biopolymer transport system component
MVAFIVLDPDRVGTQLWVRSLDATASRRIEGSDGAHLPFWSPDGSRIGFFTSDKLKTVPTAGGRVEILCGNPKVGGRGATWSPANVIVLTRGTAGPLYRVSANGGDPVPATTLDATQKEFAHRFPSFLPDGEHFLYAALPAHEGKFAIFAGSTKDTSRSPIASLESAPVYAAPGYLLYRRQAVLVAQPFDAKTLKFTGEAVPLEDEPTNILDTANSFTAGHTTSVSATGTLAYFSAPAVNTAVTWLDAAGHATGTLDLPAGEYSRIKISPDGSRAVLVRSISPTESSLWILDLARGGASPLSSGPGRNEAPVWSPDGTRIVFSSDRNGAQDFFVKTVADASPEQPYFQSDVLFKSPNNFSPDGKWLVFQSLDPVTAYDLWLLPDSGERVPVPFVRGPGQDRGGSPSPDGHWIAYASAETGRLELYVQSFPEPGHKVRVSSDGALSGWWTKDGGQLIFVSLDATSLWRADVQAGASLSVGEPKKIATLPTDVVWMDAMPDRQRFLALIPAQQGTGSITIVQNWKAALDHKP